MATIHSYPLTGRREACVACGGVEHVTFEFWGSGYSVRTGIKHRSDCAEVARIEAWRRNGQRAPAPTLKTMTKGAAQ